MEEKNNYNVTFHHHHHPYVCLYYEDAYVPQYQLILQVTWKFEGPPFPMLVCVHVVLRTWVFMYMTQKPISKPGHTYPFAVLHYVTRTEDTLGTQ